MKTRDFKDLRAKSIKDLAKLVSEKQSNLFTLIGKRLGKTKEKDVKVVKKVKKEIAQLLSLIKEKNIMESEAKK